MPFLVHSSRVRGRRLAEASDRDLLDAVVEGAEDAFDELVARKAGQLLQLVYRMVGDREEARDLVQLAFVRAWENRDRYDRRWSPNTWLYRIATNLSIDFMRSRGSRARLDEPVRRHLYEVASSGHRHELSRLEHHEVERILGTLLDDLSERQRSVFVLREIEGLSSREVGEILGCRASTVRNHLFAARRELRARLLERYPEYARAYSEEEER
ncbi:MAG: sigma-70 family RNA polymerase sigma factor [Thermoanaerobaculia bacterium]